MSDRAPRKFDLASKFHQVMVASAVLFCLLGAILLGSFPALHPVRWCLVVAFSVSSFYSAVRWQRTVRAAEAGSGDKRPSRPDVRLRDWAVLMSVLGAITIFLPPVDLFSTSKPATVAVVRRPLPKPLPKDPPPVVDVPVPEPVLPPKPPEAKVQGILYAAKKRLVIINGDAYSVGDTVYNLHVKSIERNTVTVEKDGVEKVIHFD